MLASKDIFTTTSIGANPSALRQALVQSSAPRSIPFIDEEEGIQVEGSLRVASGLKISYVPQNVNELSGSLSQIASLYEISQTKLRMLLSKLDFQKEMFDRDLSELSQGQKKKVLLACSICRDAHIYIWDEPLNFVDIFSRIQIEDMIQKNELTMVFIEHDREFSKKIATRKIKLD